MLLSSQWYSVQSFSLVLLYSMKNREYMSLVTRKPVFGVSNQGRLKQACSATEAS